MQDWVFRLGLLKHRSWSKRNFHKDPEFFHWTFRKLFLRPHRKASEAETIKSERKNPCTCQIWAKFFFTFFLKNWHKVLYLYLQFMFSKKVTKSCQNLPLGLKRVQTFWKKEGKEVKIVLCIWISLKEGCPDFLILDLNRDFKFCLFLNFFMSFNCAKF